MKIRAQRKSDRGDAIALVDQALGMASSAHRSGMTAEDIFARLDANDLAPNDPSAESNEAPTHRPPLSPESLAFVTSLTDPSADGLEADSSSRHASVTLPPPELRGPWRNRRGASHRPRSYPRPPIQTVAGWFTLVVLAVVVGVGFFTMPVTAFAGVIGIATLIGMRLLSPFELVPLWVRTAWWLLFATYVVTSVMAFRQV